MSQVSDIEKMRRAAFWQNYRNMRKNAQENISALAFYRGLRQYGFHAAILGFLVAEIQKSTHVHP